MRKLLAKQSAGAPSDTGNVPTSSPPFVQPYRRPGASNNAVYSAGAPIACIDRSPDGRSAVLGGPHMLKIVGIDGAAIREALDLRAIINAQPTIRSSTTYSVSDQLSVRDVRFFSGRGGTAVWLFTANANAKIFCYDLGRIGTGEFGTFPDVLRLPDDARQVNCLDINPHRGSWGSYLLSGSQDGIVRCFDIRTQAAGLSCNIKQGYRCSANGVRDVRWSPKEGYMFACGTEQGTVLKWDSRRANTPLLRIHGHEKTCSSIAWHPDGESLMSGGWDNRCHVWDFSPSAERRQKPKYTLVTPAPVSVVAWRPALWSASAHSRRAAQVAVSYEGGSHQKRHGISVVHVWDLARPTMPFKEIDRFDGVPAALLWHDRDTLWTAGADGMFNQVDLNTVSRLLDRQAMGAIDFSPRGDILMFLDERPQPQRRRPRIVQTEETPQAATSSSYGSNPANPMLGASRSDSDDEMLEAFVGIRHRRRKAPADGTRSAQGLSTTPPSTTSIPGDITLSLDQGVKVSGTYKAFQTAAFGHAPAAAKAHVYEYMSTAYLDILERDLPYIPNGPLLPERMASIMEQFACAAENVGLFRLAQTWRVLSFAVGLLLKARAKYHLDIRQGRHLKRKDKDSLLKMSDKYPPPPIQNGRNDETPRRQPYGAHFDGRPTPLRSLLAEEIESTSNVTTPLARPLADNPVEHHDYMLGKKLTPVLESDSFSLGPAAHPGLLRPRQRLDSEPLSIKSHDSGRTQISSTDGYDFYDAETLAKAIDVPQPKTMKEPAPDMEPRSPNRRRRQLSRHDSNDSYGQIFSISDASRQNTGLTASSEGDDPRKPGPLAPRRLTLERHHSGSDNTEEDYASRIRGAKLHDSPDRPRGGLPYRTPGPRTESFNSKEDDIPMSQVTQTTSDSQTSQLYAKSTENTSPTKYWNNRNQHNVPHPLTTMLKSASDLSTAPTIIESDHLLWSSDPPYPYPTFGAPTPTVKSPTSPFKPPPALDPYTLISRSLAFETRTSALHASAMVLLLRPLVPDYVIDPLHAASILRQHHSRLMGLRLFLQAAWLRNTCLKGWPASLLERPDAPRDSDKDRASSYDDDYGALASWGDDYPAIVTQGQNGVRTAFSCAKCHKPRDIKRDGLAYGAAGVWRCGRCRDVTAPCAVCGHRDSSALPFPKRESERDKGKDERRRNGTASEDGTTKATTDAADERDESDDEPILSTWWHCPACNHGGHSSCLALWHGRDPADFSFSARIKSKNTSILSSLDYPPPEGLSDGCCPLDGCGHACLPGPWREETSTARSDELAGIVTRQLSRLRRDEQSSLSSQPPSSSPQPGPRTATPPPQSSMAGKGHTRRTPSGSSTRADVTADSLGSMSTTAAAASGGSLANVSSKDSTTTGIDGPGTSTASVQRRSAGGGSSLLAAGPPRNLQRSRTFDGAMPSSSAVVASKAAVSNVDDHYDDGDDHIPPSRAVESAREQLTLSVAARSGNGTVGGHRASVSGPPLSGSSQAMLIGGTGGPARGESGGAQVAASSGSGGSGSVAALSSSGGWPGSEPEHGASPERHHGHGHHHHQGHHQHLHHHQQQHDQQYRLMISSSAASTGMLSSSPGRSLGGGLLSSSPGHSNLGLLSSSPGQLLGTAGLTPSSSSERERRKSVKFAEEDEEGQETEEQ